VEHELRTSVENIISKLEKLGLTTSPNYIGLKANLDNPQWIADIVAVLDKVPEAHKIFQISGQINATRNDQKIDEAFAEYDTTEKLVNSKFFGNFDELTYLPPNGVTRRPDLVGRLGEVVTPIEVKLLTPQELAPTKFFQKILDKLNKDAIPQLAAYKAEANFETGMVFVWSYQPVTLADLDYYVLKDWFEKKVDRQEFTIKVICVLYGKGLWDFSLPAK